MTRAMTAAITHDGPQMPTSEAIAPPRPAACQPNNSTKSTLGPGAACEMAYMALSCSLVM